jgi:gamma-glutamyl:cysteine ligase YbdK (ATP-grasp superfamily)
MRTYGIETELFVVDGKNGRLAMFFPVTPNLMIRNDLMKKGKIPSTGKSWFTSEMGGAQVEMSTLPHSTRQGLIQEYEHKFGVVESAVYNRGWRLIGGGVYPGRHGAFNGDIQATTLDEYSDLIHEYGVAITTSFTGSLHTHVHAGPERERILFVNNLFRVIIPHLTALSECGPILYGKRSWERDSRHILWGTFQRDMSGIPPSFSSYASYEAHLLILASYGQLDRRSKLWYDVVPRFQYGTVEVRLCSMPIRRSIVYHLAGLIRVIGSRFAALYNDQSKQKVSLPGGLKFDLERAVMAESLPISLFKRQAVQKGISATGFDFFTGEEISLSDALKVMLQWLLESNDPISKEHESDLLALLQMVQAGEIVHGRTQTDEILEKYGELGGDTNQQAAYQLVTNFLIPQLELPL